MRGHRFAVVVIALRIGDCKVGAGLEILLGGTPVRTRNFEWNLSGNIKKPIRSFYGG